MNITLIGMTGAGKSTVGTALADRLGMDFLDVDLQLESVCNEPLETIRERLNDEAFMRLEEKTVLALPLETDNLVISPGGSIVYEEDAKKHLRELSRMIYLRVPFSIVEKRIGSDPARLERIVGLRGKTLKQLYDERMPLYEECVNFVIEAGDRSVSDVVEEIVRICKTVEFPTTILNAHG